MGELAGKVAIVTGASAGIGRSAVLALAAAGAAVTVADIGVERARRWPVRLPTGVAERSSSAPT